MAKANWLRDAVLNHLLRTASLSKPTNVYLALFTADPTSAGSLTNELPIGVGGYARAAVTVGDAQWSAPATSGDYRATMNNNVISMGTASANLGTVTHVALMDAATAGNMLWYDALDTARTINNGDPIQVAAGALIVRES